MSFLSSLSGSFKKSRKLSQLQRKIASAQDLGDLGSFADLKRQKDKMEKALEAFLDLCEQDVNVRRVMDKYGVKRDDLREIYWELAAAGLGQWIKGHFAALSTIAYAEPLAYYLEAKAQGIQNMHVLGALLDYWEGKIRQGTLLQRLQ